MKALILTITFVFAYNYYANAQKDNYDVKAGEDVKDALPNDVKFRYPAFTTGTVYFKDGTASQAPLDFNLLIEEMQFINPAGDTLSLDNEATIKYITINSDTFYYSKGYVEMVAGNPVVKLARKQRLKIGDVKKIGGYGQASSTSAITSITSMYSRTGVNDLSQRADLLLVKEITFYLGDGYDHFYLANKKNLMKMFGNKEAMLDDFLKQHNTRFNNEEDLKQLVGFLQKSM